MRKHLFSATAFVMAFVMVFALLPQSVTVSAAFGDDERVFDDVPVNHWAADAIAQAVSAGYVNGYTDGTFKPDQEVTREEFLTMAVRAFELDFEKYTHTLWSMPYIMAAVEQGWIKPNQYSNDVEKITKYKHIERGNIAATMYLNDEPVTVFASTSNFPMNRAEMAQVAVMATNLDEDTDMDNTHEVMYTAVKNGIIAGMGNGDLAPDGTTTRAQAVVVIQRMLTLDRGETLPVDEEALANAEKSLNVEYDPWGRAIRTTNLPSNADQFPYILEDIPNEMYEMPFHDFDYDFSPALVPAEFVESEFYEKHGPEKIKEVVDEVETYLNMIFNVDYKTIDPEKWAAKLTDQMYTNGNWDQHYSGNLWYANHVVKNKIQIEGEVKAEPSMVSSSGVGYEVRVHLKFKVNHADEITNYTIWDYRYENTFGTEYEMPIEMNEWYEGYADVFFIISSMREDDQNGYSTQSSILAHSLINGNPYGTMVFHPNYSE